MVKQLLVVAAEFQLTAIQDHKLAALAVVALVLLTHQAEQELQVMEMLEAQEHLLHQTMAVEVGVVPAQQEATEQQPQVATAEQE